MLYKSSTTKKSIIIAVVLFGLAGIMHYFVEEFNNGFSSFLAYLVDMIYIGIAIFWIGSVRRRVNYKYMKLMLLSIGFFVVFWMVVRIVRYDMTDEIPVLGYYLWYMYYIPMIFIPVLAFMATCSIGDRPDELKSKPIRYMIIPAICMIIFVMTNDIHKQVFGYDELDYDVVPSHHSYNWGYYMVVAWITVLVLISLVVIVKKCRVREAKKKIYIPAVILFAGFIFITPPVIDSQNFYLLPEALSFTFIFTLESCIQLGLIPSNTEYESFFRMSDMVAVIKDDRGEVKLASNLSRKHNMDEPELPWIRKESQLEFGSVVWLEDHGLAMNLKHELENIQEQLSEEGALLSAENELKERRSRIEEKAKLYDELSAFVHKYIAQIGALIDKSLTEESSRAENLMYACVLTAYVKRRCNLMLMQKEKQIVDYGELLNCLRETVDYINFAGVKAFVSGKREGEIDITDAIRIYDATETIGEYVLEHVSYMSVYLASEDGNPIVRIMINAKEPIEVPDSIIPEGVYAEVKLEDDTYFIYIGLKKAGDSI